jgi:hypothetical protein
MELGSQRKLYFRLARYLLVTVAFGAMLLLNTSKLGLKSRTISGYGWPFDVPRVGDPIYGFVWNFLFCGGLLLALWYGLFWLGQEPRRRLLSMRFRLATLLLCCVAFGIFLYANMTTRSVSWTDESVEAYGWPLPAQLATPNETLSDPFDLPFTLRAGRVGTGHFLNGLIGLGAMLILMLVLEGIQGRLLKKRTPKGTSETLEE